MRIDGNRLAQWPPESTLGGRQNAARGGGGATANLVLDEDQAQLSGVYVQVQGLAAEALQFPEIRQEKVNALRQVVERGNYQPAYDQVASAMLEHMQILPAA